MITAIGIQTVQFILGVVVGTFLGMMLYRQMLRRLHKASIRIRRIQQGGKVRNHR